MEGMELNISDLVKKQAQPSREELLQMYRTNKKDPRKEKLEQFRQQKQERALKLKQFRMNKSA